MKMRFFLLLALIGAMATVPCEAKKKEKVTPEQKGLLSINRQKAEAYVEFLASDA